MELIRTFNEYRDPRTVAALQRAADSNAGGPPAGGSIEYVVVDDDKRGRERVALVTEDNAEYDPDFYATELIRAAVSVLSLIGWTQGQIERALAETSETTLARWGHSD